MRNLKGGYLILDFRDEEIISDVSSNPTQLKRDLYNDILKSFGKPIQIINCEDAFQSMTRENVYNVSSCIYVPTQNKFYLGVSIGEGTFQRLVLSSDNTISSEEL